jgi:hypothetical protein
LRREFSWEKIMFENIDHGTIKRRADEDHAFGLDADDVEKETAKSLPILGKPSVNNLARSRSAPRPLKRAEERRLILAAQAGDDRAMRTLIDHHIPWVRYKAQLRWRQTIGPDDSERAIQTDDLVSVGVAEFAERVRTWRPPHALNTHYRKAVIGALANAAYAYRNGPALGGMESNVQRFLRTHPGIDAEGVRQEFPDLTESEIEGEIVAYINLGIRPSGKARLAGFGDRYSETGTGDDDGDHDADGDFKSGGETSVDDLDPVSDFGGPVSKWSRGAAHHNKGDRYFSDHWWSVWTPPPRIGWERREQADRLAPLLKVADREPLNADQWRPQSGYVDENDFRGLGEGRSSLRSCAVKPPPPMPAGQASPLCSYWNAGYGIGRHLHKSINMVPDIADPPPSSFEAAIVSIGATEITTTHSDIDFARAA